MSISCKNLIFSYKNTGRSNILENLTFEFHNNEILCLYGGTGSGKTTLFNILFGEIKDYRGDITIDSTPLHREKYLRNKVFFLFQEPENQFVFPAIKDEYDFILNNSVNKSITMRIREICNLFNVKYENYFNRNIYQLSTGELRILQIAFCFSTDTEYFILDEPADYLEEEFRDIFLTFVKSIKNKGMLILTKYPELYRSIAKNSIPINMNSV